jgi:type II secretory pathway component PulK
MKLHTCLLRIASSALLLAPVGLLAQEVAQPTSAASAPTVAILGMIHPNTSTVTLRATVNANNAPTQYWLVCGSSPQAMNSATPQGSPILGSATVNSTVTGLKPNTTYYFRFIASNASGTTVSNMQSFTTGGNEVQAALQERKAVSGDSGVARGTVQPVRW